MVTRFSLFNRGSHVMQGNSLLALAGLVNAVYAYQNSTEPNADGTNEGSSSTEEWIACVTDTMLVILDGNLRTLGLPMAWSQQVRPDFYLLSQSRIASYGASAYFIIH